MKTKLLTFIFCIFNFSSSQWSTSTYAESALYVCPGFEPKILSLPDGSSYIAGGLSNSIYVQKLDPAGYKLWQQPVEVFNTPGTDNVGIFDMTFDGVGGLIFVWKDYRDAIDVCGEPICEYANNSVYMQRVDKDGNVVWQSNGVQVAPVDGGKKEATIYNDGSGGVIMSLAESDYLRPGATNKTWMWMRRYDKNGNIIWNHLVDSSTYPPSGLVRLDSITRLGTTSGVRFIHNNGTFVDSLKYKPLGGLTVITDSGAYEIRSLPIKIDSLGNKFFAARVIRITSKWDSLWTTDFEIPDEADENQGYGNIKNPYVSDGNDGLFFLWSFKDKAGQIRSRVQNITPQGVRWQNYGLDFKEKSAYTIFSRNNEFGIFFGDATAQRYSLDGQPIWQDSVIVLSNPGDAYFKVFVSDNNGGCIVAFWTTIGGIYVQHTGRNGKVGIITRINDVTTTAPETYELYQNYPNPFNPSTTIKFSLSTEASVKISISDILGRHITYLVNENMGPGVHKILWNANNYSSGVYFYSLYVNNKSAAVKKLLLTK